MRIYNYGSGSSDAHGRTETVSNGNSGGNTAEKSAANKRTERTSAAGIAKLDNLREQAAGDSITALRKQIASLPPEKAKPLIEKLEKMREQTNDPLATLKNQMDILSLGNSEPLSYAPTYTRALLNMGFKIRP
jgi:hypothetical protein